MTGGSEMLLAMRVAVPSLRESLHKGQAGRVAIIGGGDDFTGAPYLAAMAALRCGADLAHVLCSQAAATALKSYSCELIVHPVLDSPQDAVRQLTELAPRLSAVVLGPGLGRRPLVQQTAAELLRAVRDLGVPALVIDADALWTANSQSRLVAGLPGAVLTPNAVEFTRLCHAQQKHETTEEEMKEDRVSCEAVCRLSRQLDGVAVVLKGETDVLACGDATVVCDESGSCRRCGGQGDVLAGVMATLLGWTMKSAAATETGRESGGGQIAQQNPRLVAAYAACALTRRASKLTFAQKKRSMLASDMLEQINPAFQQLFGS